LELPFSGQNISGLALLIVSANFPPVRERYSSALRKLVSDMLAKDPLTRPTVRQMMANPLLENHVALHKRVAD